MSDSKSEIRKAIEEALEQGKITQEQAAPGGPAEKYAEKNGLPALLTLLSITLVPPADDVFNSSAKSSKAERRAAIKVALAGGLLTARLAAENGWAEKFAEKNGLPALHEFLSTLTTPLTADELKVCRITGTDPVKFAATKAERAAAGAR